MRGPVIFYIIYYISYSYHHCIIISLEIIEKESGTGSESSTSQEDEDAELINDEFESTFLKTLAKLRNKDPEIYEPDKIFFESTVRVEYETLSYNF